MKIRMIVIFLLISLNAIAQESKKVKVGLFAGPSYSSIRGNKVVEDWDGKLSYYAGLSIQYDFNENLSLASSVGLESIGSRYNLISVDPNDLVNINIDFTYLTLPILFRIKPKKNIPLYAIIGTQLGILMNGKIIEDIDGTILRKEDISNQYNNINVGVSTGVGLNIKVYNSLILDIGLRNDLGITSISGSDFLMKTNSLKLIVGLLLEI